MQPTLIDQGLNLMALGMGTVFAFLMVLVFVTRLMSWVLGRWFEESLTSEPLKTVVSDPSPVEPRIIAVIQAAIDHHRTNR